MQLGWFVSEGGIIGLAMEISIDMEPKHTAGAKSHLLLELLREMDRSQERITSSSVFLCLSSVAKKRL